MGVFLAKVLQDGRLVDLPLSKPFLKFMCSRYFTDSTSISNENEDDLRPDRLGERRRSSWNVDECRRRSASYFVNIFDLDDFNLIYPLKSRFFKHLDDLSLRRREISRRNDLPKEEKRRKIENLSLEVDDGHSCRLEDLSLTFQLNPSSRYYEYSHADLIKAGGSVEVNLDNLESYIECCYDFYFNTGVRRQLESFKAGFDSVFSMKKLQSFSPEEVQVRSKHSKRLIFAIFYFNFCNFCSFLL